MALSYSWLGKELVLDFANTVLVVRPGKELDGLVTEAQLARWLELERDRIGSAPAPVRGSGTSAGSGTRSVGSFMPPSTIETCLRVTSPS